MCFFLVPLFIRLFSTHFYVRLSADKKSSSELLYLQIGYVHFDGRQRHSIDCELQSFIVCIDYHLQIRTGSDLHLLRLGHCVSAAQICEPFCSSGPETPRIITVREPGIEFGLTENNSQLNLTAERLESFVELQHVYFQSPSADDRVRQKSCLLVFLHLPKSLKSICSHFYLFWRPLFELHW